MAAAVLVLLLLAAGLLYAWGIEPQRLMVRRVRVAIPDLPPAWQGRRVVHLSDVHCRSRLRWGRPLSHLVAAQHPDLLLFTGDLCLRGWWPIAPALAELGAMRAPLGRYWCPGNWDYRVRPPTHADVSAGMAAAGWQVLRNAATCLDGLWLVGLDDPITGHDDATTAFAGVGDGPVLVIAHHSAPAAALRERCDLFLCGHTHGGQVVLPLIGYISPDRAHRFTYRHGQFRLGRALLSVTAGIGTIFPHVRVNCPPELVVYELVREESPAKAAAPWVAR